MVTPLKPTDWKLTFDGKTITLYPSIRNWNFACRSHYWIRNNRCNGRKIGRRLGSTPAASMIGARKSGITTLQRAGDAPAAGRAAESRLVEKTVTVVIGSMSSCLRRAKLQVDEIPVGEDPTGGAGIQPVHEG